MAGRAYQSTRGNDNLFPEGNQDTTSLSKTLYSQHTKKGGPKQLPQHAVDHVVRLITNMLIQHKIKSVKATTLMCVGDENEC